MNIIIRLNKLERDMIKNNFELFSEKLSNTLRDTITFSIEYENYNYDAVVEHAFHAHEKRLAK